ncbi:hypothetical protein X975_07650, partial [Stegodyphus mimosarum]
MHDHIGLTWLMTIWKARIFTEWIGQPNLFTLILLNMFGMLLRGLCNTPTPTQNHSGVKNCYGGGVRVTSTDIPELLCFVHAVCLSEVTTHHTSHICTAIFQPQV